MSACPDCQRLAREAEYLKRIDYRSWVAAYEAVLAHQLTCHIWHVAHAKESKFEQSEKFSSGSNVGVE